MSYFGTLTLYLFLIFFSVLVTKIAYQKNISKFQKKILILGVIFLLAIFAGLRYQTGSDWYQYYIAVDYVGKQGNTEWGAGKNNYGPLYIALCKIVYWIGGNGSFFLFVMAFLTYLFLFLTLDRYKNQIEVHMSIFMYTALYYLVSYNIVRQALAITIGMYAISFLDYNRNMLVNVKKTQRLKSFLKDNANFLVFSLIASMVHNSGLVCFLALPLCYIMKKKKIKWIILIAVFLAVINFRHFMPLAIYITGSDQFRWYFSLWGEEGSYLLYIVRYAPYMLTCGLSYKILSRNERMMNLYNLFLVGLIVNLLSIISNSEIERFIFTYLYMMIIVIPFVIKNMSVSKSFFGLRIKFDNVTYRLYKWFMYIYILFTFYYAFFIQGAYKVVPYTFIFD